MQAVTLLLHQANVPEALKQFQQHMGAFKRMPLPPPPAAASAHGAWLVRQYTVMAELLSSRVEPGLLPKQVRSALCLCAESDNAICCERAALSHEEDSSLIRALPSGADKKHSTVSVS